MLKFKIDDFFVKKIGMIVTDRLVSSFDDIMDYSFTANFEDQLDRIANGELNWKEVLNSYYSAFKMIFLQRWMKKWNVS